MRRGLLGLALCLVVVAWPAAEAPYYPPPGQWAHKTPAEVGMDAAKLNDAIAFMKAHETASPTRDFADQEIVNNHRLSSGAAVEALRRCARSLKREQGREQTAHL